MKKAALHNLGCKVNAYEGEAMRQLLEEAGYEIVPFREKADVYIINTCSVTNIADRKSRQMLHRARKQNPEAAVVAAGCYVQSAAEELKKDLSVDVLIGNNMKKELVGILEDYFQKKQGKRQVQEHWFAMDGSREYESLHIRKTADHTRAFVKVQDGCNQFCSYCIIPYTRGRVRSRTPEDVEQEAEALAASGCQEIVLTGIHLSSYGADFQEQSREGLPELIGRLHRISGISRIRLGSLEPGIITRQFVSALTRLPKVCPHFHLSLQSGCDETLRRMNRHYTTEEYAEKCDILRESFENPAITTDVIVGFPGETQEEFEETKAFLQKIRFYEMHVFKYSVRSGTRAAKMPDQIPESVKTIRSEELLSLEQVMSAEYRKSFLGKRQQVLLEEETRIEGTRYLTGHTREYIRAAVLAEGQRPNTLVTVIPERMLTEEILL
ncbi:tRNA (N(6)-L-threonylcarbamoyladenosine(37)-C(2))-methylthiotransferase MtaB [bacterium D16-54]|nr:tRNA (N(6)-L-threonylcarbamoyladenosine(37)-C(2))-methylthiotransferase MtaB [bacterium D16-54]RKJ16562.1 tRNA (N(6)-L-threonylcarbamoyladenosine(37)-C(2))-methylthiotransferase MtaB [bacterium D16-56]